MQFIGRFLIQKEAVRAAIGYHLLPLIGQVDSSSSSSSSLSFKRELVLENSQNSNSTTASEKARVDEMKNDYPLHIIYIPVFRNPDQV